MTLGSPALLRLLHLASPGLPIGAFAYSQGLEYAAQAGWVRDEATAGDWILGLLGGSLAFWEVPVFMRLERAWRESDEQAVGHWNDVLFAGRATAELQAEDQRVGCALARVLTTLDIGEAGSWAAHPRATQLNSFALACASWEIPPVEGISGYLFAWTESQVGAAMRLVRVGQSAGLRILDRAIAAIPAMVERGQDLRDEEIGAAAPGQALASALHETQYSRIFRS